ncbi:ABC transporter permease [Wukongibacter baidiensis]|uniref:ABC transporter permease n=1 Tax=Wukongibacter baidiensis TaxID=1723361 RepID=UPI003D7FB79E
MIKELHDSDGAYLNGFQSLFTGFDRAFAKAMRYPLYKYLALILGLPVTVIVLIKYYLNQRHSYQAVLRREIIQEFDKKKTYEKLKEETQFRLERKYEYFYRKIEKDGFQKELEQIVKKDYERMLNNKVIERMAKMNKKSNSLANTFIQLYQNNIFRYLSYVLGFFMYIVLFIFKNPYLKYIFERILMLLFVIFGVTFVVFTILYFSPMDPARNILGKLATEEQVMAWKELYGLNAPYHVRLFNAFKNVLTFDFGNSYVGNEPVMEGILRKFPITLKVTSASLLLSIIIAVPAGIISSIKQYSAFDFASMIIALIGISIPNFWLGLMLILLFSVKLGWLNVIYSNTEWTSLIMPAIVLGTALAASCARMTRSSMLEVIKSDYIITARAKGLKESAVILKHGLRNAIIPIITIIGLQFGGMLGGSAVTEKVFTIPGLGSHIVSKQMIPDVPVVLAGVVYIAIIISLANLFVDILYAFFDPRIKAKLKKY